MFIITYDSKPYILNRLKEMNIITDKDIKNFGDTYNTETFEFIEKVEKLTKDSDIVYKLFGEYIKKSFLDIEKLEIDYDLLKKFPKEFIKKELYIPYKKENGTLYIVGCDPLNILAWDELQKISGLKVNASFANYKKLKKFIDDYLSIVK